MKKSTLDIKALFGRLFGSPQEEVQVSFKDAYRHFKCLISANNKALEIMARMEDCLNGERFFDMVQVRTMSTQVITAVYQIVREMERMAPGRYSRLKRQVEIISNQIRPIIEAVPPLPVGALVYPLSEVSTEASPQVGNKMAVLGELFSETAAPVADGFVVSAKAYWKFMQHDGLGEEIDRILRTASADSAEERQAAYARVRQKIMNASLPQELTDEIYEYAKQLSAEYHEPVRFVVRSSALGEDSPGCSFAGQYASLLNVNYDNLLDAYREVIASKYEPQNVVYRRKLGVIDSNIAVCVGVQAMIDSACGGVVYTQSPLDKYGDGMLIYGSLGLPHGVVSGRTETDRFIVDRAAPYHVTSSEIAEKEECCLSGEEGVRWEFLKKDDAFQPVLSETQLAELAAICMDIEKHFSTPQDIEWALRPDGQLVILQSRPLLSTDGKGVQRAEVVLHENEIVFCGGETASSGVGAGVVAHAVSDADISHFPKGAVLVVPYAEPRWASLLPNAAAVVSEKGTLTGHLANVAREFGVPALFGVPDAMTLLSEGTEVTVDASGEQILSGRHEALLGTYIPPHHSMKNTPVHKALQQAAQHITPLHLTNPDDRYFRIDQCTTLHDITRFCHERAVIELFSDGRKARFPHHKAHRLFVDRPMQFWVLNLDDGFTQEPSDGYVRLDQISSAPMHALWGGMMAVPWDGPPPVNARGFLSILAQSATNPGIEPGVDSPYSVKNYFCVSKPFCSLQSRFGYHFCSVEAIAGEFSAENFIGFKFTGGAADRERRILRVQFVESILTEFGFRVLLVGDRLSARIQGRDKEDILQLLKVVGYLITHTRQLDMAMTDKQFITKKRQKFMRELDEFVLNKALKDSSVSLAT